MVKRTLYFNTLSFMVLFVTDAAYAQPAGQTEAAVNYITQQQQVQADYYSQQANTKANPQNNGPTVGGASVPDYFVNPILPGSHPDPSICRVKKTYFLVTGSGPWYPGIPVYQSRDLVNWKAVGHVLDRPSQLDIHQGVGIWDGVDKPSIVYHKDLFYVCYTLQCRGQAGAFYVTAEDPAGPWSDPVWLNGPGIDPSFYFDEEGHCWFLGTHLPKGYPYFQNGRIVLQEYLLAEKRFVGPVYELIGGGQWGTSGFSGARLQRLGDTFVLWAKHGRSEQAHVTTWAFTAKHLQGPYQANTPNPVFPNKALAAKSVTSFSHGDLVETPHHTWWGVCQGVRKTKDATILGRESFLVPFAWEQGRPQLAIAEAESLLRQTRPELSWFKHTPVKERDEFALGKLSPQWNFYHTPNGHWWSCVNRTGWLSLKLQPQNPARQNHSGIIARRIQDIDFYAATKLDFTPKFEHETAGLIVLINHRGQYRLAVGQKNGKKRVSLIAVEKEIEKTLLSIPIENNPIQLAMDVREGQVQFWAGTEEGVVPVGEPVPAHIFSQESAGGDYGAYVGMFTNSHGIESQAIADFDWFAYRGL